MGADYAPVLQRLGSERIVTKFALRFLEDKTFSGLCDALDAHDAEEAFRMAHTLKGICLNLGFEPLRRARPFGGLRRRFPGSENPVSADGVCDSWHCRIIFGK